MTAPVKRSQRIREFIVRKPGQSLSQVVAACEPKAPEYSSPAEATKARQRTSALYAAQLQQLCADKAASRTGVARLYRYWPTATTLVDGRCRSPKPASTSAPTPANASETRQTPGSVPKAKATMSTVLHRGLQVAPSGRHGATRSAQTIAADIERFVRDGGRIELVPNGVTSQPLLLDHSAHACTPKPDVDDVHNLLGMPR